MRILATLLFLAAAVSGAAELKRLDPHGKVTDDLHAIDIQEHDECRTCHVTREKLKDDVAGRCVSCHNAFPHSGVEEHRKLTCLSCHRPHRAALSDAEKNAQDYFKKHAATVMMKKTCEDCHQWKPH